MADDTCPEIYPKSAHSNAAAIKARAAKMSQASSSPADASTASGSLGAFAASTLARVVPASPAPTRVALAEHQNAGSSWMLPAGAVLALGLAAAAFATKRAKGALGRYGEVEAAEVGVESVYEEFRR